MTRYLITLLSMTVFSFSVASANPEKPKAINSLDGAIEHSLKNFPLQSEAELAQKYSITDPAKTAVGEYTQLKGASVQFPSILKFEYRYRKAMNQEPFLEATLSEAPKLTVKSLEKKLKLKFENKGLVNPHEESQGYYFQAIKEKNLISIKTKDAKGSLITGFTLTAIK